MSNIERMLVLRHVMNYPIKKVVNSLIVNIIPLTITANKHIPTIINLDLHINKHLTAP